MYSNNNILKYVNFEKNVLAWISVEREESANQIIYKYMMRNRGW